MNCKPGIRRAQSRAHETQQAVREFYAEAVQPDMAFVVFFCSSAYDLAALAAEMKQAFAGIPVIGCTTAGEIGPAGYLEHSLTGASFPASDFKVSSARVDALQNFSIASGHALAKALVEQLSPNSSPQSSESPESSVASESSFALLLIDGLSIREEPVTRTLQSALGQIPLVGGSAGDGANFGRASVYHDGAFHADIATLTVVTTQRPTLPFQTHHFVATDERLVVTEADTAQRVVTEINGVPAAEEYARVLGIEVDDLTPELFAARPVVVVINGVSYVRSIQKANPDGSLTFFCAIDNGLILRVAKNSKLLGNLEQLFDKIRAEIGSPDFVFGFDCLLRRLEIFQSADKAQVVDLLLRNNTTGFGTYGEQYRGVHVNQTFTGIAIGSSREDAKDA